MTDPTADTSAIEAALDNLAEEYDRLRTLHDAALADNARLTAALGDAEEDMAEEARELNEELALARTWVADAATGRAVGRRLRDGWHSEGPLWVRGSWHTQSVFISAAEAAWLASLDEEGGT